MVSRVPTNKSRAAHDRAEISAQLKELQLKEDAATVSVYGSHYASQSLPKWEMPESSMPKDIAYRLIQAEMTHDGIPTLNLASFVTTFMEKEAEELMTQAMPKNSIDYEEYPATTEIQNRCVAMVAHLCNAPHTDADKDQSIGTSTVGSSEAIMLGVLAMKRRWQNKRKEAGLDYSKPNIVMNSAVQVCWEKAARYFEVEERYVYCTPERHVIDPVQAVDLVDENTIGICAIMGTTYTGEYEDVKALNDELIKRNVDCGIHVDAASGGFVAPFVRPELEWDFRLPRVVSINLSGHKYGLVYPGVGWCVWRDQTCLPKELIFSINYLGAEQSSFTLNFSRGASQIIGQYYQLIRLGKAGYRSIMLNLTRTADYLADQIVKLGFILLSETGGNGLPLVAFRLDPAKKYHFDEFAIAHRLRERGWIIPAYTLAPHAETVKMMRVVVREDFSMSSCDDLVHDIKAAVEALKDVKAEHWDLIMGHIKKVRADKQKRRGTGNVKDEYPDEDGEGEDEMDEKLKQKTRAVC